MVLGQWKVRGPGEAVGKVEAKEGWCPKLGRDIENHFMG